MRSLKSLACGTPVITTKTGGMLDYVNANCGWLLPKGDVTGAMELLAQINLNRDLTVSRRTPARNQALRFDWKTVAGQVRNLYCAVINSRQP